MLIKLNKFFKKQRKKIGGKFRRYSVNINPRIYRPGSSPFISGDTLRKEAIFIFDETQTFKPSQVKNNDLVFMKSDLKNIYFKIIHPQIESKYILISHNSDEEINDKDKNLVDDKIVHWFAQNLAILNNNKFSAIPIGFENRRYLNNGKLNNLKKIEKHQTSKNNMILSSYNSATNFDLRSNLDDIVKEIETIDNKIFATPKEYLLNLSNYKFLLCPEGNGIDTHRIWEGLLTKTVPIVKKSSFAENFYNLGIPILLIENWSDLKKFDENKIEALYEDFTDFDFLKFVKKKFWLDLINEKKMI